MKTIFDKTTRDELINRITTLNENSKALWGKMNVYQMSKHSSIWGDWILGTQQYTYKQEFLGKIFGKWALKSKTKDDKPMGRNMPAGIFTVKEKTGDLKRQMAIWQKSVANYEHFSNDQFIHDFFGKMTKAEIGILAYKHYDHHLRQFNA